MPRMTPHQQRQWNKMTPQQRQMQQMRFDTATATPTTSMSDRHVRHMKRMFRRQNDSLTDLRPSIQKFSEKPTKKALNSNFFRHVGGSRFLVIDAEDLGTSREIQKRNPDAEIHVVNIDPDVIHKADENGFHGCSPEVSTEALLKLIEAGQKFGLVYLDYCNTPDGNKGLGFKPASDISSAYTLLDERGCLLVTYSRRTSRALEKSRSLLKNGGFSILHEHRYCDTSPMVVYLAVKDTSRCRRYHRRIRRSLISSVAQ